MRQVYVYREKNTTSYGTIIAENFPHPLENFANSTVPMRSLKDNFVPHDSRNRSIESV